MEKKIDVIINVPVVSEANSTEHWHKKARRHTSQKWAVKAKLNRIYNVVSLPCVVVMTRLSPRKLDDDNLVSGFKWIRDQVADCFIPGLKAGRADDDARITWKYDQEKSKSKGFKIEIYG